MVVGCKGQIHSFLGKDCKSRPASVLGFERRELIVVFICRFFVAVFILKKRVKKLSLFGSYARNEANPTSDIDILVEFSQPVGFQFFELANKLEKLLNHSVDLVSRNGIKPNYFAEIQPDLIDVE